MSLNLRHVAVSSHWWVVALALVAAGGCFSKHPMPEQQAQRETPAAAIRRAGQPLIADDRATAEKLLGLRFLLKSVLSADEWAKVLPTPATAQRP